MNAAHQLVNHILEDEDIKDELMAAPPPPPCMVTFVPQRWVRDYAVNVDPEGPTTWDASDIFYAAPPDQQELFFESGYESDSLRDSVNAPQWVKDWDGPFYIYVDPVFEGKFYGNSED